MALATTCPQCKTSFKVVPDQLKLRRGLVRCGVCQHVFSGIDYLRYVDDAARAAQRAARERAAAAGAPAAAPGPASASAPAAASGPPHAAAFETTPTAPSGAAPTGLPPGTPAPLSAAVAPHATSGTPMPPPGATPAATASGPLPTVAPSIDSAAPPTAAAPAGRVPATRPDSPPPPEAAAAPAPPAVAPSPPAAPPAPREPGEPASFSFVLPDIGGVADAPARPDGAPPGSRALQDTEPSSADAPATPPWAVSTPAPAAAPPVPAAGSPPAAAPTVPSAPASPAHAPPPVTGLRALPAPETPRVPLDELLTRPAAPWPSAAGPQTVIDPDGDLKTAFFLTDSSFGPLPVDTPEASPPTSIHRPAPGVGAVVRAEGGDPTPATRAALPGLPLRPERGEVDTAPAFVPSPPVPLETAPRRTSPLPPEPAIDYFAGSRRSGRGLGLALSPAAWAAAIGLSALLALQGVVGWRDAIAARVPLVAPTLAGLLGPFGLEVAPPREIDALTIEGFELQATGVPNALSLSAVLRNRSGHVVGFPAMELTLTDGSGALLVRKVIPADLYAGDATTIAAGLAARSERPIRLTLQHDGLQPTGYAVALFYP